MNYEKFRKLWFSTENHIVCHTSGSTGGPKDIKLTKADMKRSALATLRFFGIGDDSTFVCPISLDYIGGKMMAVRAIVSDGKFVEIPPSNTFKLTCDADLVAIVPSQTPALINASKDHQIKNLIIGGAPLSVEARTELAERGINAWQTYGMTETSSHVALAKVGSDTPVYEALDDIWFEKDNRECLVINRPGYDLDRIITNDMVELLSDKKFRWLGRFDNVINSGGLKINSEELEAKIAKYFPILKNIFYIRGKIDSKWGTVPELVIEESISSDEVERVLNELREYIDPRQCPRTFVFVPSIQRTPNGKIKRT